jgi:hypothetical protein
MRSGSREVTRLADAPFLPAGEGVSTNGGAYVAMVESSQCDSEDLSCLKATVQGTSTYDVQVRHQLPQDCTACS